MTPRIAVLLAPGINCYEETAYAIQQAGGQAELVLDTDICEGRTNLSDFDALVIPGGFSFGDHFGAGRVAAILLGEYLRAYARLGRPIIGICNGFQILMEAKLFDGPNGESGGALVQNNSGLFESRRSVIVAFERSPWTEGLVGKALEIPVAHAEGRRRLIGQEPSHLTRVFSYTLDGACTELYPDNPNGSPYGVAALAHGMVMGMMPHPERATMDILGSSAGCFIFSTLIRLAQVK